MKRVQYEYKIVTAKSFFHLEQIVAILNKEGKSGWILVSDTHVILMREIIEDDESPITNPYEAWDNYLDDKKEKLT